MNIIAWRPFADFRQQVALAGQAYILRTRWNSSFSYWTLDIFDIDNTPLIYGLKLTLGSELLLRYNNDVLPDGALLPVFSGTLERIERDSMGETVNLVFIPTDELETIEGVIQ